MAKIRQLIENNLGWTTIVLSFVGLAFPYGDRIPDGTIIFMLAVLMFLSCFKITGSLGDVLSWRPFAFWILRYTVFPVVLWMALSRLAPAYALGAMLLSLCPAATVSAALTGMYNGKVSLALFITILSSTAGVFLIPAAISCFNQSAVALPILPMFRTLSLCILLPGALYLLLRRRIAFQNFARNNGKITVVLLVSMIAFVGLSKKRDFFLVHPESLIVPFLIVCAFFAITLLVFALRARRQERIAYGVCSAFINTSLGLGIAILYLDEKTVAVLITALFLWSFLPIVVERIIGKLQDSPAKIVPSAAIKT